MKRLTENEFEEILNKIKDVRRLDFSKINEFNNFNKEDQARIIREWTIYGSEDYKIELADEIIKQNDNEPYTEARIAKYLNVTHSLAIIIKDYVLAIEEGEIFVPTKHEKCIKSLRQRIEPFINDKNLEPERRKILKEELDGICEKGDPEGMMLAMEIARMLRTNNQYYYVLGRFTSSLVAFYLKIHNVDCFKHKLDFRMCHGLDFEKHPSLDLVVSQEYLVEEWKNVEDMFFADRPLIKIANQVPKTNKKFVSPGSFVITDNEEVVNACSKFKDCFGREVLCLNYEQCEKFKIAGKLHYFYIVGTWNSTFLNKMNQVYPIKNIDLEDTKNLNILLKRNCLFEIKGCATEHLSHLYNKHNKLTYDQFKKCVAYDFAKQCFKSGQLDEDFIYSREEVLNVLRKCIAFDEAYNIATSSSINEAYSSLKNKNKLCQKDDSFISSTSVLYYEGTLNETIHRLLLNCFYFANFPEESVEALLTTRFCNNKIKNNVVTNNKDHEKDLLKQLMVDYHSKLRKRFIGVFFIKNRKLNVYKEELNIDETKAFVNVHTESSSLFNSLHLPKGLNYSKCPGGRVLYNVKKNLFCVYADEAILKNKEKLELIKKEFALPRYNIVYKSEEH